MKRCGICHGVPPYTLDLYFDWADCRDADGNYQKVCVYCNNGPSLRRKGMQVIPPYLIREVCGLPAPST